MNKNIINKTSNLKTIKPNTVDIHPLINYLVQFPDFKRKNGFIIPQKFIGKACI